VTPELAADPGSFRDPDSRVFLRGDEVLRALSKSGLADWEALSRTGFFERAQAEGRVVPTQRVPGPEVAEVFGDSAVAALRHERIPVISYPYEWPFSMLRDAARLQLELLRSALAEDMILKDASPYNVQFRGAKPVFIDVGSFERLPQGEPWAGYRQFCCLFLFPLMLQAYAGLEFQPWLRGSLEGIAPVDARAVLRGRHTLRRGVLTHVALHARLEQREGDRDTRSEVRRAGFRKEMIEANAKGLERLVTRLDWGSSETAWSGYGERAHYDEAELEQKDQFVRDACAGVGTGLAFDLGANDGRYSRIASEHCDYVVAVDGDQMSIDALYRRLREEGKEDILPLVMNLADASPARGWRGRERSRLEERGRPDLVLCLALVHHLSIAANVPLAEIVDWLASLGGVLVIEFADREDEMVQRLLARKPEDAHPDYHADSFERALTERFDISRREELASGRRTLYEAHPRVAAR
jgi:SAM-dependent methyltransferase